MLDACGGACCGGAEACGGATGLIAAGSCEDRVAAIGGNVERNRLPSAPNAPALPAAGAAIGSGACCGGIG